MLGSSHAPCGLKDTTTQTHDSCYPQLHIAYTVAMDDHFNCECDFAFTTKNKNK